MDRRDVLKVSAAVAVLGTSSSFPASVSMGKNLTVEVGDNFGTLTYPVTDGFYERFLSRHPDLTDMPFNRLVGERDMLLKLSDARAKRLIRTPVEQIMEGHLTWPEADRLAVVTHVINCHTSARYLRGRPLSDFGFTGIDEVHGNSFGKNRVGECGCVLSVIFNHAQVQAKSWAHDLANASEVRKRLLTYDDVPQRAHDAMVKVEARYREGFFHYADIAGIAHMDLALIEKIEVEHIPHYGDFVCVDHRHLAHDPVALHAAVFKDNEGVADVIERAYREIAGEVAENRVLVG